MVISARSTSESLDATFDALSNHYRRRVLFALLARESQNTSGFSLDSLVTREYEYEDPERTRIELYHSHLPNVAEKGYVNRNPDFEKARQGPDFDNIVSIIRLLITHEEQLPTDLL